ncbi:serine/threonine-protein phosphatase 6 regulatory ankyrin repeat subunit A-like [Daphnia pulicaria]|uniref:serine/threonine-protein phosphatase 6 regulatory ankyrin repeat subunit A-like n=1 Tax=Daphnia pulicaria TaxID=35523 RepID=UPI001EEBD2EB|nr:serine/threonine-protein phosphatase 6 regulatory ankyrin repeat subunit A-like [Daphnia pulicaria]
MAKSFKSTRSLTGGDYKQKLYFVPCADNEPKVGHEISEPAIFRFLLNEETMGKFDEADEVEIVKMLDVLKDIDKPSKITQVEAYQSSMRKMTDAVKAYHVFIVFKSTSETADDGIHWWSLEKNSEYIVLQRSRNQNNVINNLEGKQRKKVKPILKELVGKGTIKDLFAILWAHQMIPEKYNILYSNCQFLVTFVGEQITEIGYKFKGYFKYYPPPEKGRDKQMLDLINVITGCSDWSPLFHLIKMGNTDLVDKIVASGKYDINASCNGLTPLHLAIKLKKTKMVKHLLEHPAMNADPTKRDAFGKSALLFAVSKYGTNAEIIDLLLAHDKVKVDDVDEHGRTALHLAADRSNVVAVRKLIEKRANPNIYDKWGQSPLHVAAERRDLNEIIDLLLVHPKVKVDDVNKYGQTALHAAVSASNVMAVEHLINKGANPNAEDKWGESPLLVAAGQRDGIPIIDLLLEAKNVKGLGDVNDANKQGRTALHYAAAYSNEITAEHLIKKGADVNCRANVGLTPLHYAVLGAKDMKIIDLLLQNINEGDIRQYRNDKRLFFFARHNLHGLGNSILDRLVEKGIQPPCTETDHCTGESGLNTRRFVDKGADDTSIDLTGFDGLNFLITRVKKSQEIDEILKDEDFDINGRNQIGETLLLVAILGNNVNAVRRLLERGADPTIRDEESYTLIHEAVFNHTDSGIINLLLESGKVDINETDPIYGVTALHMAVRDSNTATAGFLLSKGANPNIANKYGYTPLHYAASCAKDMDIVELLLNHKDVDVNLMNEDVSSALCYTKYNAHGHGERIANLLKEKGAVERENGLPHRNNDSLEKLLRTFSHTQPDEIENLLSDNTKTMEDKISKFSEENLISVIMNSDVETLCRLLKNGADISRGKYGKYGKNALHLASRYAKTTVVIDAILETGKFDINGVDNRGWTPLHLAILGSNAVKNARHLIGKGADPNIADKNGVTLLHLATIFAETTELIDIFLETGQCNINGVDNDGRTPLYWAIERYAPVTINVRRLIKMGADPGIADKKRVTPLHVAAKNAKSMDLIEVLLNTEAVNVNCVDNQGRTPLACARDNKHGLGESIIDRLKEYGAKE